LEENSYRALFDLYDVYSQNFITFATYLGVLVLTCNGSREDKIRFLFCKFDSSRDGELTYKEFQDGIGKFATHLTQGECNKFCNSFFQNIDMSTRPRKAVTYEEFHQWVDTHEKEVALILGEFNILEWGEPSLESCS